MTERSSATVARAFEFMVLTPGVAIVFFLVLTPAGILFRHIVDPLRLRRRGDPMSYWNNPDGLARHEQRSSAHPGASRNS